MTLIFEQRHLDLADKIAKEANTRAASGKLGDIEDHKKYYKAIHKRNISVFEKKKLLIEHLHTSLIKTFALHINKIDVKRAKTYITSYIAIIRKLVMKIEHINYYLETTFLEDIGLKKPRPLVDMTKKQLEKIIKEDEKVLSKKDFDKLEHMVFHLIDKIVYFDKSLLRKYKKRERIIVTKEKIAVHKLEEILKKQSELLHHLEAKLPPANQLKDVLFNPELFTHWVSRILSLAIAIEHSHLLEQEIIKRLKKDKRLSVKIEAKISHLAQEKWEILKIKEKKILSLEKSGDVDEEWQKVSHDWSTVSGL